MIYLEAAIQRFSENGHSFQLYLGNFHGREAHFQVVVDVVLAEAGSLMGVSQVFYLFRYLLCERLFLENCP